jgi:hypothetical protein
MKIGIILPSRGQVYSRTLESILSNVEGYNYDFYFSHGLPIPQCFNDALELALEDDCTHLWFVEEDMHIPSGTLKRMLSMRAQVSTCDYPVTRDGQGSIGRLPNTDALFCGTGCMLVRRQVFDRLNRPYFRSDIEWSVKIGDYTELTGHRVDKEVYGFHDITFGLMCYEAGVKIKICPVVCGQYKLVALGEKDNNVGQHSVELWNKVDHSPKLFDIKKPKRKKSVSVQIDGKSVLVPASSKYAKQPDILRIIWS